MSVLNNGSPYDTRGIFSPQNRYPAPPDYEEGPEAEMEIGTPSLSVAGRRPAASFIEELRIDPSHLIDSKIGNKSRIRIQKPNPTRFVRAATEMDCSLAMSLIKLGDPETEYVLSRKLLDYPEIASTAKSVTLTLSVDQFGTCFLWPVPLATTANTWLQSHKDAAAMAKDVWVRVYPDHGQQRYTAQPAVGSLNEPLWPRETFADLLMDACEDRMIRDVTHPLIQAQLFGK